VAAGWKWKHGGNLWAALVRYNLKGDAETSSVAAHRAKDIQTYPLT
jgi:hypothetical protein